MVKSLGAQHLICRTWRARSGGVEPTSICTYLSLLAEQSIDTGEPDTPTKPSKAGTGGMVRHPLGTAPHLPRPAKTTTHVSSDVAVTPSAKLSAEGVPKPRFTPFSLPKRQAPAATPSSKSTSRIRPRAEISPRNPGKRDSLQERKLKHG